MRLVNFADIDAGLAVLLRADWAQLFPHGGPRVVQKLCARLVELGATSPPDQRARAIYLEAGSDLEADMLATLAQAASPAAIELLLAQPSLWKKALLAWRNEVTSLPAIAQVLDRSAILDRLLAPPAVAVVGRPNVGKSTLSNRILGRNASIVADMPGTTRDWVAGLAEIHSVAVRWLDTPGLRHSDDAMEQQAITLALDVIQHADLLIALRDPKLDWPELASLPRKPDLWVMGKCDLAAISINAGSGSTSSDPLPVSAVTGTGIDQLELAVLQQLQLADPPRATWAFSSALRKLLAADDLSGLRDYAGLCPADKVT